MIDAQASRLLTKGVEEEVYAGSRDGVVAGLSPRVTKALEGFTTEPDSRNIEAVTEPHRDYAALYADIMNKRRQLREYLLTLGAYTLIPGGTLSLGDSRQFLCSDEGNPYYVWIRNAYGSNIVTTSAHINIGMEDPVQLFRACRIMRADAGVLLALSAASPFLDGVATDFHSTRWNIFPKTPARVPLFRSHDDFKHWVEKCIASGDMQNRRHLWVSVRPNGLQSPYDLNRLELRICDHVWNPHLLLALTALYESMLWNIMEDGSLDLPGAAGLDEEGMLRLIAANEDAVARLSLDAQVMDWRDGRKKSMREVCRTHLDKALATARKLGYAAVLQPLEQVLREGNTAQQWLARHAGGESVQDILRLAIVDMEQGEKVAFAAR